MKRALLGLALAAILPLSAQASELSYNYIEGGYAQADWGDADFDGGWIAGSVAFNKNWYGSASFRTGQENDFDLKLNETAINLGFRHGLSDKVDFIAEVGYVREQFELDNFGDESEDGWRAAAGVRGMLAPKFEAGIKGTWTDVNGFNDGEFGVDASATFHINQTWGITGNYQHTQFADEDFDVWGLGVRASF